MQAITAEPTYQTPSLAFEPVPVARPARPIHVLLVEDDPDAAALVSAHLRENNADPFHVEWKQNLLDSMTRLGEPGIDVVLLDLGLPELKGYKSYRAIGIASADKIPVMVLTSDDRALTKDLTLGFGAAGYLLKGKTSPADLRQALRDAVLGLRTEQYMETNSRADGR